MTREMKAHRQPDGRFTIYAEAGWLPQSDPNRKLVMETNVDTRFVTSAMVRIGRANDFQVPNTDNQGFATRKANI
jgi:hypothetical protein